MSEVHCTLTSAKTKNTRTHQHVRTFVANVSDQIRANAASSAVDMRIKSTIMHPFVRTQWPLALEVARAWQARHSAIRKGVIIVSRVQIIVSRVLVIVSRVLIIVSRVPIISAEATDSHRRGWQAKNLATRSEHKWSKF